MAPNPPGVVDAPNPPGLNAPPGPPFTLPPGSEVGKQQKNKKTPKPAQNIATVALNYIGFPYIFSGCHAQGGWDCSGAVNWWVSQAGCRIPGGGKYDGTSHGPPSAAYLTWGKGVPNDQCQAGDVVVWPGAGVLGHVGVAISNTEMISALNPTMGTTKSPISGTKAGVHFTRRASGAAGAIPAQLDSILGDLGNALGDIFNPLKFLEKLLGGVFGNTSIKDLAERGALIFLGVILLLIGLYTLAQGYESKL